MQLAKQLSFSNLVVAPNRDHYQRPPQVEGLPAAQMVTRESYSALRRQLREERIAAVKESAALRHQIVHLEAQLDRQQHQREHHRLRDSLGLSLSRVDPQALARDESQGAVIPVVPTAGSQQLIALGELSRALEGVSALEEQREEHEVEEQKLRDAHELELRSLNTRHNAELRGLHHEIHELHVQIEIMNATWDVERQKMFLEAKAHTASALGITQTEVAQLKAQLETVRAELAKVHEIAGKEEMRANENVALVEQLRQQVLVLLKERSELKDAMLHLASENHRLQMQLQKMKGTETPKPAQA